MSKKQCIYWIFKVSVVSDFWSCDFKVITDDDIRKYLSHKDIKSWVFQTEAGAESDYLHYQGWVQFKSKKRFEEARKVIPEGYWEESNGPGAERYCTKVDTRINGPWSFPYRYYGADIITQLRDWQQEIVEIVSGNVDPRKIYWYWEKDGNVGKSALCKYLVWWHKAILMGGKTADAMFSAVEGVTAEKPIYIFDIPRNGGNKIAYNAVEMLKNGLGFSPKYESKMFMAMPAHIIVFANSPPDYESMSADRWVIKCIGEKKRPLVDIDLGI